MRAMSTRSLPGSEQGKQWSHQTLAGGRGGDEKRRKREIISDFGLRIANLKKQKIESLSCGSGFPAAILRFQRFE
jgi:hypothetical protein